MPLYCPNCSAELLKPEAECWNCGAAFGEGSTWMPIEQPAGTFERREKPKPTLHSASAEAPGHSVPSGTVRLSRWLKRITLTLVAVEIVLFGAPWLYVGVVKLAAYPQTHVATDQFGFDVAVVWLGGWAIAGLLAWPTAAIAILWGIVARLSTNPSHSTQRDNAI
jgi:hypothetical protein